MAAARTRTPPSHTFILSTSFSKHAYGLCSFSSLSSSSSSSLGIPQQQSSRYFSDQYAPAKTSKDGVVGYPIDFDIHSKIDGNESQIVTIQLQPGQVLRAESGAMMYMTKGVQMNTTTGGGLSEGFRRMMTGQNFFISDYTYEGEPGTTGTVALGTDFPSKIIRLNVEEYGGKLVCQKGALLYVCEMGWERKDDVPINTPSFYH
jgi:hypothetical protein